MNYALAPWLPLSGTGVTARAGDAYAFRCSLGPGTDFSVFNVASSHDAAPSGEALAWYHTMIAQFKRGRPVYSGDLYPLTQCSTSPQDWLAYQMHRDDLDQGLVLVYRRQASPFTSEQFVLQGLDASRDYRMEFVDTGEVFTRSDAELGRGGIPVTMAQLRDSQLVFYQGV